MDKSFVLFRYPSAGDKCGYINCDEHDLPLVCSYDEVGRHDGFVFAPFKVSPARSIVIFPISGIRWIGLDEVKMLPINDLCIRNAGQTPASSAYGSRETYHEDFIQFQAVLHSGLVRKAVLSRAQYEEHTAIIDLAGAFAVACHENPDSFVALVSSETTGTWLLATPEVLVEENQGVWHTVALAGTQPKAAFDASMESVLEDMWDRKNIEEQEYVASYIREKLKHYAHSLREGRPQTVQAGNLLHIRTDFYFDVLPSVDNPLGRISADLHPTPAVCGSPADTSMALVNEAEHCDRQYYSGFCGIAESNGGSRLYVTLRCARIYSDGVACYAGGGILPESDESKEWKETEMKMATINRCIQ